MRNSLPSGSCSRTRRESLTPHGLISAITVRAKLVYQELWRLSLGWDYPVPPHICKAWSDYEEDLKGLIELWIPRRISRNSTAKVELHGFGDALEQALGGVIYLRVFEEYGLLSTLVSSKTKIVPLKQVSLPRLELEAALLTTKLIDRVK